MDTHSPAGGRQGFNTTLNGFRGVCALLVYLYHCGSAGVVPWPGGTPLGDAQYALWSSLAYGVDMFFMISGFVILGSLLRHQNVGAFLKDRFIRIFTVWVPTLIAFTLLCVVFPLKTLEGLTAVEATLVFVANLFLLPPIVQLPIIHIVSWSLSYEWVFYFAAAGGFALTHRPGSPRWAVMLWAAATGLFVCLFPRSLFFLTGVLVYRHREWFAARKRWLRYPIISLPLFLMAWHSTRAGPPQLSETMFDFLFDGRWIGALIAFAASLHLFASIALNASREFSFLNGRTFQFLGTISYSFYLWHPLTIAAMRRVVRPFVIPYFGIEVGFTVFAIGAFVISIPLSWLSWRLFEVQLAQWVRRKRRPPPVMQEALRAP